MKFKVGDKVRVILSRIDFKDHYIGSSGNIINNEYEGENRWLIYFENEELNESYERDYSCSSWVFFDDELELVRYKYTRLAEKLFPKGHKEGDWWILD
jgi:hypothetical protein